MKILLDTHTFLWWNENSPRLSQKARDIISSGQEDIYLSAASTWEIALKAYQGKLILPEPPGKYILSRITYYQFAPLPVHLAHTCRTYVLPGYHTDPFDRLLIAQCQLENMTLLSADEILGKYDIQVVW